MEPIIKDAEDRLTSATKDMPIPLPLFLPGVIPVHHTCSDMVEEYSLSSEKGPSLEAQLLDLSWCIPENSPCEYQGSTHFFIRTSPIIGAYTNGRSYAGLEGLDFDYLVDTPPFGAWPSGSYQIPGDMVPTSPSMSTHSLSPPQLSMSSSTSSSLQPTPLSSDSWYETFSSEQSARPRCVLPVEKIQR